MTAETLGLYVHTVPELPDGVVVDVYDGQDRVFAERPAGSWPDVDRAAVEFGVPAERISVDDDARAVLDES